MHDNTTEKHQHHGRKHVFQICEVRDLTMRMLPGQYFFESSTTKTDTDDIKGGLNTVRISPVRVHEGAATEFVPLEDLPLY